MKVLAIDPGSLCGYCWTDGSSYRSGCWRLTRPGEHDGARLMRLRENLHKSFEIWGAEKIGYEESSLGAAASGGKRNIQWSTVVLHNQLRGIVLLVAAELELPAVAVNPMSLKAWAAHGRATKAEMIEAAFRWCNVSTDNDNEADAVLVAEYVRQGLVGKRKVKKRAGRRAKSQSRKLF